MPRRFPLASLALSLAYAAAAQSLGGLPGALEWQSLRSDSVTLVTTAATQPFAARALALDEALVELRPISLGPRIEPVDVVVQPVTAVPNGFVGLAPFRSYLYATPPQQQTLVSTNAWVDALAVHEYRHVEQFANLRRGWTRFASVVAGDAGWGSLTGLSTPDWFFEGDAVYAETALTFAGRGRTPAFTALQRALAREGLRYPYALARNGSLRLRVPDHYPLGYALVTHGRTAYADPWPDVVQGAGTFWPPVYPFSLALKRATGLHTPAFYREAYDSLAADWRAEADALAPLVTGNVLTESTPAITRYATPQLAGPDQGSAPGLYAQRRSQRRIGQLVELDARTGRVARVVAPLGATVDGALDVRGSEAAWSRLRVNPRRSNDDHSVIAVAHLGSGRVVRFESAGQLFSPTLRPNALEVTAVEVRTGRAPRLVTLSTSDGSEVRNRVLPFDFLATPRYTHDGKYVVAVAKTRDAIALVAVDVETPDAPPRRLSPWTRHAIGRPAPGPAGEYVYFSASFTGIDNVFRVPLDGSAADAPLRIEQVTNVPVGAYGPDVSSDGLYYATVEVAGDPVVYLAREDWLLRPLATLTEPVDLAKYAPLRPDGNARTFRDRFFVADPATAVTTPAPSPAAPPARPYRGLLRGFSVHTWQPLADQNEATLTVIGSNVLNDLRAEVEAGYNLNEESGFGTAELTLARTWPWVSLRGGLAARRTAYINPADSFRTARPNFREARFGVALEGPLRQVVGAYTLSATPGIGVDRLSFTPAGAEGGSLPGVSSLTSADVRLGARALRRQAPQQILPRFGLTLDARYRRGFGELGAAQLTASVGVLLPGLARTHGLFLRGHARAEDATVAYQFQDFYNYARGYAKPANSRALGGTAEYHLPLLYPDVGLWGIAYARRLRAAAWIDATRSRPLVDFDVAEETLRSVGVDLTLDAVFFNVQELPIGVRFAYRLDTQFGAPDGDGRGWAQPRLLLRLPL